MGDLYLFVNSLLVLLIMESTRMTKYRLNVIPAGHHYYLHASSTVHNQLKADFCHCLHMQKGVPMMCA